jgi:hypothetical protein
MALAIRDLLRQSGVPVWLRSSHSMPAHGNLGAVLNPDWGEILVEELDYERALEIVTGFLEGEVIDEDTLQ